MFIKSISYSFVFNNHYKAISLTNIMQIYSIIVQKYGKNFALYSKEK